MRKIRIVNRVCDYLDRDRDRERDLDRDRERDLEGDLEGLRLRLARLPDCERDLEREADLAERLEPALRRERLDATLPASEPLPEYTLPSESDMVTALHASLTCVFII